MKVVAILETWSSNKKYKKCSDKETSSREYPSGEIFIEIRQLIRKDSQGHSETKVEKWIEENKVLKCLRSEDQKPINSLKNEDFGTQ